MTVMNRQSLHLGLDAQPQQVSLVRRALQTWLAANGWPDSATDELVFAVVEAFSNSVQHAYPGFASGRVTIELALQATTPGRMRVLAVVTDFGHWRDAGAHPCPGNGLALIRSVSQGMTLATGDAGTCLTVWTDDEELVAAERR
ncbi:ATP-binding protein [Pseudonocardia benzenivorans]|uniref:ATP-binding protein n=1 Tax=Pseudonocardia benzenivorans TaxID=228005 RepID=A0ABW3VFZ2_9PSEU|nr:hypothetical protein PSD17_36620 [Pseudonocardia sp. D17]